MKKRVLVAMIAGLLPLFASAEVSSQPVNKRFYISVPDTIAKQDTAKMDLEDLENKLKEKPKFLIFCNPHNPLGKVWTYDELKAIGNLCIKYGVTVISDEIHSDLTLWDNQHIPMASVSEEIRKNTITCTSTGKAFNVAGLQCATIVFNNLETKEKFYRFWKDCRRA